MNDGFQVHCDPDQELFYNLESRVKIGPVHPKVMYEFDFIKTAGNFEKS